MTSKQIIDAWATIRKENNSIPDEVLDFMKDAALGQSKCEGRVNLTPKEAADFSISGSDKLMVRFGGGIGSAVSYMNKFGKWIDITDYETW